MSVEERRALEGAVSRVRSFAPNIDMAREGERADTLFIFAEGWGCRYTTTREGGRQFPALLMPGDAANLDSLMFDRLDYGIRTITQAKIMTLPRDSALALALEHPGIMHAFAWLGLVENAVLCKWAQSLGRRSALARLAHLLCEINVRSGVSGDGSSSFAFPLTQEQIADALGLTSVHVNRTMQHLRASGLIETANRMMTIPDLAKLRHVGGFNADYLHIAAPREAEITTS